MTKFAADDSEAIAKRLKEIEAARLQALTGEETKVAEVAYGWPYTAATDYDC